MQPYERFEAWQLAHQLVLLTYRLTEAFPVSERYGLRSQARRAAFSVAANIVEGSAKRGPREFRKSLDTSLGSMAELGYAFRVSRDLGILSPEEWQTADDLHTRGSKVLWGLYQAIAKRADNST